jgi:hypothetical protein
MSLSSGIRELRRGILIMLETHIVMSSLIFHLVLILVFRLALTLVLHLTLLLVPYLMDLTTIHMVLVHERTALSLDALVTTHVLVVVIVFCVGLVFLLEGHTHFEPRQLDSPRFLRCGSRPTRPNGEVQRTIKTSSGRMVK